MQLKTIAIKTSAAVLATVLIISPVIGYAQGSDPAAAGAEARRVYNECVDGYMLQNVRSGADANSLAESAFQSCYSEEMVMRMLLRGLSAQQIDIIILKIKIGIKTDLRNAVLNEINKKN